MNPALATLIVQLVSAEFTLLPGQIQAFQTLVSAVSGTATVVPNAELTANDVEIQALLAQLKAKVAASSAAKIA